MTTDEPIPCKLCEGDMTYVFMFKNEVWARLGFKHDDKICLTCAVKRARRLGIHIGPNHFSDAMCNDLVKDMFEVFLDDKTTEQRGSLVHSGG